MFYCLVWILLFFVAESDSLNLKVKFNDCVCFSFSDLWYLAKNYSTTSKAKVIEVENESKLKCIHLKIKTSQGWEMKYSFNFCYQ